MKAYNVVCKAKRLPKQRIYIIFQFRNRKTNNRILTPQLSQNQFIYHESVSLKSAEVSQ